MAYKKKVARYARRVSNYAKGGFSLKGATNIIPKSKTGLVKFLLIAFVGGVAAMTFPMWGRVVSKGAEQVNKLKSKV